MLFELDVLVMVRESRIESFLENLGTSTLGARPARRELYRNPLFEEGDYPSNLEMEISRDITAGINCVRILL